MRVLNAVEMEEVSFGMGGNGGGPNSNPSPAGTNSNQMMGNIALGALAGGLTGGPLGALVGAGAAMFGSFWNGAF